MARFRCRAPYFMSVPSCSSQSLRLSVSEKDERRRGRRVEDALLHNVQLETQDLP